MSSKWSFIWAGGTSSYTYCRIVYVGWMSKVTRVTTPKAPSPATAPRKVSPSAARESFTTSPAAVAISRLETAVARLPFFSPEPWPRGATSSGDRAVGQRRQIAQRKATVRAPASTALSCIGFSDSRLSRLSAIGLKQWRVPGPLLCPAAAQRIGSLRSKRSHAAGPYHKRCCPTS
jgi:hypothetical protein